MQLLQAWLCATLLCALIEFRDSSPNDKLYMLDIRVPRIRGQIESTVIRNIRKMFFLVKNIKVLFQLKVLGNRKIITILRVERDCAWAKLTGLLFEQRVRFQVVPLYRCDNFAAELGVQLYGLATAFSSSTLEISHISFYTSGYTVSEYFDMLKDHMQRTKRMIQDGVKLTCFRILSHIPVRMIYFTNYKPSQAAEFIKVFEAPERFTMTVRSAQTLRQYKRWCI